MNFSEGSSTFSISVSHPGWRWNTEADESRPRQLSWACKLCQKRLWLGRGQPGQDSCSKLILSSSRSVLICRPWYWDLLKNFMARLLMVWGKKSSNVKFELKTSAITLSHELGRMTQMVSWVRVKRNSIRRASCKNSQCSLAYSLVLGLSLDPEDPCGLIGLNAFAATLEYTGIYVRHGRIKIWKVPLSDPWKRLL